jgi:hypothetical protein
MNLAAILGCLLCAGMLSLGSGSPSSFDYATTASANSTSELPQSESNSSSSQSAPPAAQIPAAPSVAPAAQTPGVTKSTKPPAKHHPHPKKAIYPDCQTAPSPLNAVLQNDGKLARPASTAQTSDATNHSQPQSGNSAKSPNRPSQASAKPCLPPKKIVRNGGSNDPKIELLGGNPSQQASDQRSTEQLDAAIEENLKKLAGRQLNPNEQDTVNQIRQYMEQSKQAIAAGDPERAHNLAIKARLLSDQLLQP